MASAIVLNVRSNQGYSIEQVQDDSITLQDLLEAVEQAIQDHGAETKVVLDNGQRYGAQFGNISQWDDIFSEVEEDDDLGDI